MELDIKVFDGESIIRTEHVSVSLLRIENDQFTYRIEQCQGNIIGLFKRAFNNKYDVHIYHENNVKQKVIEFTTSTDPPYEIDSIRNLKIYMDIVVQV